jgi:hypothetical protein
MSVLMTMRVRGDTARFREFIGSEAERLREIADESREVGCIHHRFGIGDGYVLVLDEWESPEAFQRFFEGNERIETVMRESGAQGEPEISFTEAIETAGQF